MAAARREASEVIDRAGRLEEFACAARVLDRAAHEAGDQPLRLNPIHTDADYVLIDPGDLDRVVRLRRRARDHALALLAGDFLRPQLRQVLRLPSRLLRALDLENRRS